jgi:hypothetical protein
MNPYLEDARLWPAFSRQLVGYLDSNIGSVLPHRYRSKIAQRGYTVVEAEAWSTNKESVQEDYIEIHEEDQGALVTLLDVVSPLNKTTRGGRQAFLETRKAARRVGANVVEIDLILQGRPLLEYSREGLPHWDYAVTVTRSTHADRYEIYTSTLDKRLPRFPLPLRENDRLIVVDLTTLFSRVFMEGGFADQLDYHRDPPEEVTSRYAYRIWEREGHPHGRDLEHWFRAIAYLRGMPVEAASSA